jgi:integrase
VYRGLRRGELVALRWCDLDLGEGIAEIRRNMLQPGSRIEEGTPKSEESNRLIALDADSVTVLRGLQDRQRHVRAAIGLAWDPDGFVFAAPDGQPLNPDYVSRHLAVLIKAAEVPLITLHQLRHYVDGQVMWPEAASPLVAAPRVPVPAT